MANEVATDEEVAIWLARSQEIIQDPHSDAFARADARDITALCRRIDADARRIAELERVTGPTMPCGCYAVECAEIEQFNTRLPHRLRCNVPEHDGADVTPEYLAWKENR